MWLVATVLGSRNPWYTRKQKLEGSWDGWREGTRGVCQLEEQVWRHNRREWESWKDLGGRCQSVGYWSSTFQKGVVASCRIQGASYRKVGMLLPHPLSSSSTFFHAPPPPVNHTLYGSLDKANVEGPNLGLNSSFLFVFPPSRALFSSSLLNFHINQAPWELEDHFQIPEEDIITLIAIRTQFNPL